MWRLFCVFLLFNVHYVYGNSKSGLCNSDVTQKTLSCTNQILGSENVDNDACQMELFPANSKACGSMEFRPPQSNNYFGGVSLKPHLVKVTHYGPTIPFELDHAVLNITFSNIKWKIMRFLFHDIINGDSEYAANHCRVITLSNNITIDDRSVLYYDCYWPSISSEGDTQNMLEFEATSESGEVHSGRLSFNIPSVDMLSPIKREEDWKPFIYVEIIPNLLRLHIVPPPSELTVNEYEIRVMVKDGACPENTCQVGSQKITVENGTKDITFDYPTLGLVGNYSFEVTPLHKSCRVDKKCKYTSSPYVKIAMESHTLRICIVSLSVVLVATLFAYYLLVKYIRKNWCQDYKQARSSDMPSPPKVLVIHSPNNGQHAKCVASLVSYLRNEFGFGMMYDGDIANTVNGNPHDWAQNSYDKATHIMYIVGPTEQNPYNIYDKPITAYRNVDKLLLNIVQAGRSRYPKEIFNIFFDYSNGEIPIETKHDPKFHLLKDWNKLISFLSKNMAPKQRILMSENGKCFIDELNKAEKVLNERPDEIISL